MIEIISGTNRPASKSLSLAKYLLEQYRGHGAEADILDLCDLKLADAEGGNYYGGPKGTFALGVDRVTKAEGLVMIIPEYNGTFPGILKLFIDYWRYPDSSEHRPIALIGLGHRWGGLRPVEHMQQALGYRSAYVFPNRVFLTQVNEALKDGQITDPLVADLLDTQTRGFIKYIRALESEHMDANSILRQKAEAKASAPKAPAKA